MNSVPAQIFLFFFYAGLSCQWRCKCPVIGIGGLSNVSLVLVAAHAVPQLVLATPNHVSPFSPQLVAAPPEPLMQLAAPCNFFQKGP